MLQKCLGKPIAEGYTAEVYGWDAKRILKLFRSWCPSIWVEYEDRIARMVHAVGLPVPAVGEIMEINGRHGLIYERVEGPSMIQRLWMPHRCAVLLAELHADVHAIGNMPELPAQRAQLERNIRAAHGLPPDLRQAVLRLLEKMPDGDRLCHGDFHPGNVLMTNQQSIIIDWITAARGNPLADVCISSVLLLKALASHRWSWQQRAIIWRFHTIYLGRYFQLRPGDQEQCKAWQPIVAAAQLSRSCSGEVQKWLLATVETCLSENQDFRL